MTSVTCPGWRASWVNAWLAAVGATVRDERIRVHWTTDTEPVAVLSSEKVDPVAALIESWPDAKFLSQLPIAADWQGYGRLRQNPSVHEFQERVRAARGHQHSWTLSSTLTDLRVEKKVVANAPFNPGVQRGVVLYERLVKVHQMAVSPPQIHESIMGQLDRVDANGLGFDHTRIGSMGDRSSPRVDPIIEVLAFFGLALLPVRARDTRLGWLVRQRGWRSPVGREQVGDRTRTRTEFHWPAWSQPLDRDGIDALLDVWNPERKDMWLQVGVHSAWRTLQYRGDGNDVTVGFGSERL